MLIRKAPLIRIYTLLLSQKSRHTASINEVVAAATSFAVAAAAATTAANAAAVTAAAATTAEASTHKFMFANEHATPRVAAFTLTCGDGGGSGGCHHDCSTFESAVAPEAIVK